MNGNIVKVRTLSIWIFLIPFIAVNICLYITTNLHSLIEQPYRLFNTFPYIDGGTSISRTARYFPNYLIFKPAMILTSYLLIKYWILNKEIVNSFEQNHKYIKKFVFFGIASAIALTIHSIFLGIKFDNDIYKLFRRIIMLSFIVFEIVAQTYLVATFYSIKDKLIDHISLKILRLKLILVSILIVVALISFFPIVVNTADGMKSLDTDMKKLLLTMGASNWQIFRKIMIPSSLPYLFSGVRIAVSLSVIGAVIGEWVGSSEGLGYLMIRSKPQFLTELVFASIFILSAIGIGLFLLVGILEKLIIPWYRFENFKE